MSDQPVHHNEADVEWELDLEDAHREARVRTRRLLSSDVTPTSGVSVGTFEMPPGSANDPHHHEPPEVYYVIEGSGEVLLDEEWKPLSKGDVVFIPGGITHGTRNLGNGPCKIFWAFPVDSYEGIEYFMD
jgi:quercetin dioxygenase-like cupin family protein